MDQYGKLNNGQLEVVTFIDHGQSRTIGINAETAERFGLKEIVDVKPDFYNYEVNYTETETQIIVNYVEVVVPPEPWHEDTNYQIKFTERSLRYMLGRVPDMVYYTNTLEDYDDMMGNVYFYVNNINDEELPLLKEYAEIYDKMGNKL